MRPDRWRELDALLGEAMEREPEDRAAWLERRCAGDAELLDEVRSLLALEERSREFLETPALIRDPDQIADYRIVRRLATGGSAVVYEARREGEDRPVALKVIRGRLFADERRLRRFRREVRTLARLRHPSIARILEAGSTEDGQRFFTMELVRGRELSRYVEEVDPPLEERLWLFRELCDAIHYAHQCGVIHRDVKPSNILVDEAGRPKILDFGLARLVETDASAASSVHGLGEVMGTLPYMSPEQAAGRSDVDARTDVYSLGVVLYELATGELPFDFAGLTPYEGLHLICHQDPVRPSLRRRELRGDLETIVLQALARRPERRYRSAAELGADVGRFLEGRPIAARPPHPLQRLRAAAAAHRLAASALAALLLALSVFSATVWIKNRELRAEHDRVVRAQEAAASEAARAGAEADRARAVLGFLSDMLSSADPDRSAGRDLTVREVLDQVAGSVEEEFGERPRVRAEIHRTLGLSYLSLGRDVEAAEHLGAYLDVAAAEDAGPTLRRAEGRSLRAQALSKRGLYEPALAELERSLALHRALHPDDERTAGVLAALGATLFELGRTGEAEQRLAAALALAGGEREEWDGASLEALTLVAEIRWQQGDRAAAEERYREALARQLDGEGEEHTRTARILGALGQLCAEDARFAEAQGFLERSLAVRLALLGPAHPESVATRNNLATLHLQLGRVALAEPMLVEVLDGWRALGLTDHEDYAVTLSTLGAVRANLGRYEEAEESFREALEVFRSSTSGRKDALASHVANLARVLVLLARTEEAEELAREALELRREVFGEHSPEVAGALAILAELQLANADVAGAVATMREAQAIRTATLPPGHPDLADGANTLAVLLQELGELDEAERLYRESLDACLAVYGEAHPSTALRLANLGGLLLARGEPREAEAYLAGALAALEGIGLRAHPEAASVLRSLAEARRALGETEAAERLLAEALALDGSGPAREVRRSEAALSRE